MFFSYVIKNKLKKYQNIIIHPDYPDINSVAVYFS